MPTIRPSVCADKVWLFNPDGYAHHLPDDMPSAEADDLGNIPSDYYLAVNADGGYQLCDKQTRHQPLTIDFKQAYYRFRGGTEWLPKALKGLANVRVADVTAGWGRDSWLLAYRGFSVVMFERNPYLQVLLQQGLAQAQHDPTLQTVAKRLSLCSGDARRLLDTHHSPPFAVVYLDPMYPNRRKKAKVKKDMQALQHLLGGEENDGGALLDVALGTFATGTQRVVVKRPQGAPPLNNLAPDYSIEAPNTRFDVYLPQSASV